MTLASKEPLVNTPAPSVSINVGQHIYPELEINSAPQSQTTGEEGQLIEKGDMAKLNELKELSKKIEKDLEAIKKQGREIEQKLKEKETPPKFCFFLNVRVGAIIIGFISMVLFTISVFGYSTMINVETYNHNTKNEMKFVNGVMLLGTTLLLLALFKANLLLLGVFLNHKSYVRTYLALTVFCLNCFIIFFLASQDQPSGYKLYGAFVLFGHFSVFEAFALYNVYRFYQTME